MSWEAQRLTSRTPSEVYAVLGPHGVEELLHNARNALWREYPQEQRTFDAVRKQLVEVFERNMKVWSAIKTPTPQAFFDNLLPHAPDGHIRQALVLTWMMMPRAGGRDFKDTTRIVRALFDRLLANWDADNLTFTKGTPRAAKTKKKPAKQMKAAPKPKPAPATRRPTKAKKASKK